MPKTNLSKFLRIRVKGKGTEAPELLSYLCGIYSVAVYLITVAYRVGCLGFEPAYPRNSEAPPKSCQMQPDCENC